MNLELQDCDVHTDRQRFLVPANGVGKIEWAGYRGKCIDVVDRRIHNGNNIQLWDCDGSTDQNFNVPNGLFLRKIQWRNHPEKCLDVLDHQTHSGNNIQIWDCFDWNTDQTFSFDPSGGQYLAVGDTSCPPRQACFQAIQGSLRPVVPTAAECVTAAEALAPGGGCYGRSWAQVVREIRNELYPRGCMIYAAERGGCALYFNPVGRGSGCPDGVNCAVNVICLKT